MISKNMTTFEVDGVKMVFNTDAFQSLFKSAAKRKNEKLGDFEEVIGLVTNLSKDAVHNWRFCTNGPSDIETIKKTAKALDIRDYTVLLKKAQENIVERLSDLQKESVKRIYDSIIDFLWDFENTSGFVDYYDQIRNEHPYVNGMLIKNDLNEKIEEKYNALQLQYRKEYMFLKDHPIYEELRNLLYGTGDDSSDPNYYGLAVIYEGKISFDYRFNAGCEDHPSVDEDYEKGLRMINDVIDRYVN